MEEKITEALRLDLWANPENANKCEPLVRKCVEEAKFDKIATQLVGLFPFEVWLMEEKGYQMVSFDFMNAYYPGGRRYEKDGKSITLGFGCNGVKFYFYFRDGNYDIDYKSVPYKIEEFEAALQGLTPNII